MVKEQRNMNPQKAFEVRLRLFFENFLWILCYSQFTDPDTQESTELYLYGDHYIADGIIVFFGRDDCFVTLV